VNFFKKKPHENMHPRTGSSTTEATATKATSTTTSIEVGNVNDVDRCLLIMAMLKIS
jgi:hypothetical protein